MKYPISLFLTLFSLLVNSCSKGDTPETIAPSNLVVNANVSNDNSGNVTFSATATNAVSYEFDFGNGTYQTVPSGNVTYKYPASGTYSVNVIAKSSSDLTVSKSIQVTVNVALSLFWSDEFNTAGTPDPSKWGYDIGTGSNGWGNAELEYYTSRTENVSVSNGTLKITARKESYNGSAYTSARMHTMGKFSFKYGKVEVRAKLPEGVGTWPAIWMLGDNIQTAGWPACGEIDIMEHKGSSLGKIYGTMHYPGHYGNSGDGNTVMISNVTTEFHRYGLEWSAASIKVMVDDVVFFNFTNNSSLPFNQKFFIILNLAIGGGFGGPVDPSFTNATMEIDYVRVYQ